MYNNVLVLTQALAHSLVEKYSRRLNMLTARKGLIFDVKKLNIMDE